MAVVQRPGTIKRNPKAQTQMKTSRKERRKNFEKNISWDMLYKARGYGPIRPALNQDAHDRLWQYARKCEAVECENTTGGAWLKPDGKWYCAYCHYKIPGLALLEQSGSVKEPKVLVEYYQLYLLWYKIQRWFKCVTRKE